MTLPVSPNPISFANINTEVGAAAGTARDMAWVKANTKPADTITNFNSIRGYAWYTKNNAGNCNNGNCPTNCNCGGQTQNCNCYGGNCGFGVQCNCNCSAFNCAAVNCVNCQACANVNCRNCDARAWLQPNCNCQNTNYNCAVTGTYTTNCSAINCNCACTIPNCNCQCCTDGA